MKSTFESVPEIFLARVEETPDRPAFLYPQGSEWKTLTWKQTGERVVAIAGGLRALGLKDEQRVGILSSTRYEWIFADLAILCGGGATTTIYPANTAEESAYILADSNAVFCFVEDPGQVEKLRGRKGEIPEVKALILLDGEAGGDPWVLTLSQLEEKGRAWNAANPGAIKEVVSKVKKDHLATLIYTSGTTGKPKGVELTHDCWVYEGEAIRDVGVVGLDDMQFFWLPLAHSFGKVLEAAQVLIGFPTAIDGRVDKLVDNLAVIKPSFMAAVPRIFEKVYNKVISQAQAAGGLKYKIFLWSMAVGREVSKLRQNGLEPSGLLAFQHKIADKLVFSKLRARFGGRLRFFISGSAPLSKELAEFFHAAGILVLEGYGLTETSAATFVNRPEKYIFGSVGKPLKGTEMKLASDGEILIRGRGVMRGYHGLAEATAEVLKDGWLHTGDIGEVDPDGYLKITDRKKDLIKTSGGKYVAPQAVEAKLKLSTPLISQAVVHGNNRNFCSALITLNEEEIVAWARAAGLAGKPYSELTKDPKLQAVIEESVKTVNASLAKHESIRRFHILPADLSIETGELTPSLKVKRKVVETKYKDVLEKFYEGAIAGE